MKSLNQQFFDVIAELANTGDRLAARTTQFGQAKQLYEAALADHNLAQAKLDDLVRLVRKDPAPDSTWHMATAIASPLIRPVKDTNIGYKACKCEAWETCTMCRAAKVID